MQLEETKVVVVARFVAKEDKEQELLESMQKLMEPTHKEPGCLRYELNRDVSNPRKITYIEKFRDQAAFDSHVAAPYIKDFFQNVAPNLVAEQEVTFHREVLP